MTDYQKIATIIFRAIGAIVLILSLLLLILAFLISLPSMKALMILITFAPYLIAGVSLFVLSRFLAKLVCYDFDKANE